MSAPDEAPVLSIVVAPISARPEHVTRCLEALRQQEDAPPGEILLPYDAAAQELAALRARFPEVRFLPVTGIDTARARRGATREQHDTLRTAGLRAARGRYVALTEDHARAAPNWSRDMVRDLEARPRAGALGGAVECDSAHALNWAVWFCDFGRYQGPLADGPAAYVSDSNVVYRREALERVHDSWADDYHETLVHDALRSAGYELELTSRTVVWQARQRLAWRTALRERFVWGRSYAASRVHALRWARRLPYLAAVPLLPALLTWRVARNTLQRGRLGGRLLRTLPAILLLHTAWALGEGAGYLRGRA